MHKDVWVINRTRDYGSRFTNDCDTQNELTSYADASYADSISHKSQTGYIIIMNGAPISWKSKCQTYVTLSTQEAEIVAACDCIKEVQYNSFVM